MPKRHLSFAGLAAAIAIASTAPAGATTLEKMSMEGMARSAELIVVGIPTDSFVDRQNGQIVTHTTFQVSADALGDAPSSVTVVTPGGRISNGKIQGSEIVAGAPVFPGGREVMLFLNDAGGGEYQVTGFNQGYFSVANGEVQLAPSDGGATDISDAFELVRQARAAGADQPIED